MRHDLSDIPGGELLRLRRRALGLTQAELAERTGVPQPNISAIENGSRSPSGPVYTRLLEALRERPSTLLSRHREEILRIARENGVENLRVFGSVARGDDTEDSDVDLLATLPSGQGIEPILTFLDGVAATLATPVDLVGERGLVTNPGFGERARREAVPL